MRRVAEARWSAAFLAIVTALAPTFAGSAAAQAASASGFVGLNPSALAQNRALLRGGDDALRPAASKLEREADRALNQPIISVTQKQPLPPSGDRRDYLSIAPYWWPNPAAANGLPYVRRDGEINPERERASDRKRLDQLVESVQSLSLGYYFTGKEAYAEHAGKLLRAWFLAPATKMNPHLRYAQAIPGRSIGRGNGIIETHDLPKLIDAEALLQGSNGWSRTDHSELRDWFSDYVKWLRESPAGQAEAQTRNNHGTWYDVQVASFAGFSEQPDVARQVLNQFSGRRVVDQIEPDGRQPRELARTRPWHYSLFNLEAIFDAASLADQYGIDLWNYASADKRSIRGALEWLIPFATGEKTWPYKEPAIELQQFAPLLRRGANAYREPRYEQPIAKLPKFTGNERWRLLYPIMNRPR